MDISTITDMNQLKAMAYDTLQVIDVHQANLRLIKQRIAELEQAQEQESATAKKK